MATRVVEGKKPYTGGKAIDINKDKVISLKLRDENNLIIYDEGDDEIYVDLQLPNEIEPTDAFPVGVNTGRVIVDNGWDLTGTIICAKTTSGDEIKLLYADEGTLWMDNGTGTFKQVYFKADVDLLISTLTTYINTELAKKQNGVTSDTAPSNPSEGDLWYDTTSDTMKVWDGTAWQSVGTGGGGSDIVYATQAEYNALLPGALTDNKHYFIYSTSGGGGRQPGANTLVYLPLNGDVVDYSTYNRSFTVYGPNDSVGSPVFDTLSSGKKVADITATSPSSSDWFAFSTNVTDIPSSGNMTISFWINWSGTTNYYEAIFDFRNEAGGDVYCWMTGLHSTGDKFLFHGVSAYTTDFTPIVGTWYNMVCVVDNGMYYIYKDGNTTPIKSGSYTYNTASSKISIGAYYSNSSSSKRSETFNGKIGDIILEDKARTAQEVSDYYNLTKGDYGIS